MTIYDFKVKSIAAKEVPIKEYSGKVLLIVNTASECGYTPQYDGLEELYKKYGSQGFSVLGFPSNEFGKQEPGTNDQIQEFCKVRFGVTFPLFAKGEVKGSEKQPLFKFLTEQNPEFNGEIKWNFEKFLIDRTGKLIGRYKSDVEPNDKNLVSTLEKALG